MNNFSRIFLVGVLSFSVVKTIGRRNKQTGRQKNNNPKKSICNFLVPYLVSDFFLCDFVVFWLQNNKQDEQKNRKTEKHKSKKKYLQILASPGVKLPFPSLPFPLPL